MIPLYRLFLALGALAAILAVLTLTPERQQGPEAPVRMDVPGLVPSGGPEPASSAANVEQPVATILARPLFVPGRTPPETPTAAEDESQEPLDIDVEEREVYLIGIVEESENVVAMMRIDHELEILWLEQGDMFLDDSTKVGMIGRDYIQLIHKSGEVVFFYLDFQ